MNTLLVSSPSSSSRSLSPSQSQSSSRFIDLRPSPLLLAVLCAWSGSALAQQTGSETASSEPTALPTVEVHGSGSVAERKQ